jgi:hypothetical protein
MLIGGLVVIGIMAVGDAIRIISEVSRVIK